MFPTVLVLPFGQQSLYDHQYFEKFDGYISLVLSIEWLLCPYDVIWNFLLGKWAFPPFNMLY